MFFEKERVEFEPGLFYEIIYPLYEIESFKGNNLFEYVESIANEINILIISFAKISSVNSSGLRNLLQISKNLQKKHKKLYLVQLAKDMKKIFIKTNLDRLFRFGDSIQDVITKGGA